MLTPINIQINAMDLADLPINSDIENLVFESIGIPIIDSSSGTSDLEINLILDQITSNTK